MTRRSLLAVLAVLLCNVAAWATEPKAIVRPPQQVEPGDIVFIDGSDSTGDAFQWVSLGAKPAIPSESGKSAYFATGKPGEYRFLLVVAGSGTDGHAKIDTTTVTVTVIGAPPVPPPGPTPPPGPSPGPGPTPPPSPVITGHLYVTYLADAAKLLPSHAAMKAAPMVREAFKTLDASWRWYQNDEEEPRTLHLLDHVKDLPTVIIQGPDGKVLDTLSAPSEADVIKRVKELRGAAR